MGLVKMAEEITGEWEDINGISPYVTATLYIYCDRCGTFSIRTRLGYRRVFLIMFICILLAVGILVALQIPGGIFWFGFCLIVCFQAFRFLWGGADYVCRKCGGVPNTCRNTLGYPPDIGILDVPERLTQKQYRGYFPDNDNMDEALMLPAGLPPKNRSVVSGMRNDLDGSNGLLFFILAAPFFIIYIVTFPILVIVYLLWTEVISKLFAVKSPRENS